MFKLYGTLGILLILFTEINFFLKLQPFASWYYIIVWSGYILLMDAIVYKLKKESLISTRPYQFIGLLLLSALFWWTFEILNLPIKNWNYNNIEGVSTLTEVIRKTIFFTTVLPAVFETAELFRTIHLFDRAKLKRTYKISRTFIHIMIALGIAALILPFIFPKQAFPLIWFSLFLILDPINYLHKQPSIIKHLKDRKLKVPLSLLAAGLACGFLWEFWNYWAITKWYYNIPYVNFLKIFEMPLLGYLGYLPFALELYAMYWFTRSLFLHKEHLLAE